jgi:ribosome biogenesis GTPase
MQLGIVVRSYSGYHYLRTYKTENGNWFLGQEVECTRRGRLKRETEGILVGDLVEFSQLEDGRGVIEKVLPRGSRLGRPAIANIDQVVITIAVEEPKINLLLLDRMLVAAEAERLRVVICINKTDLLGEDSFYEELASVYSRIGYPLIHTCAKTGEGIESFKKELEGHISALAGPSGVGKSSILNAIDPALNLESGKLSTKTSRGRHTTRFAQLLVIDSKTLVADTPGFTALRLPQMKKEALTEYFPEFGDVGQCRFRSCLHRQEPDCAVQQSAAIAKSRYQNYLAFLGEIEEGERRGKY